MAKARSVVRGTVFDDESVVAGAEVDLSVDMGSWRTTTTDKSGRFSFELVVDPGAKVSLVARRGARMSSSRRHVVGAGDVRLQLQQTVAFEVTVVSEAHEALPGVSVRSILAPGSKTTDSDGRAVLLLPDEIAMFTISKAGYATGRWNYMGPMFGSRTAEIVLRAAGTGAVIVQVLNPEDLPVEGKVVRAIPSFAEAGGRRSKSSGADGAVRFDDLAMGHWMIALEDVSFDAQNKQSWTSVAVDRDAEVEVTLVAGPRAQRLSLSGVVVDADGAPIPNAELRTVSAALQKAPAGLSWSVPRNQRSAVDGSFEFEVIGGRPVELHARSPRHQTAVIPLKDLSEPLHIVLTPGLPITGLVLDGAGEPAAGVRVVVKAEDTNVVLRSGEAPSPDSEEFELDVEVEFAGAPEPYTIAVYLGGQWHFPPSQRRARVRGGINEFYRLLPGASSRYTLKVTGEAEGSTAVEQIVTLDEDLRGRVRLMFAPVGAIDGQVLRADDGSPIRDASFRLWPSDGARPFYSRDRDRSDADGVFRAERLVIGSYSAEVALSGFSTVTRTGIEVRAGESTGPVIFELEEVAPMKLRCLDARSGKPIAMVVVEVHAESDGWSDPESWLMDPAGHSTSESHWPAGTYALNVSAPGYVTAEGFELRHTAPVRPSPSVLRLTPAPRITGRVMRGESAASAVEISLTSVGGGVPPQDEDFPLTITDAKGRFAIGHHGPGRYHVGANPQPDSLWSTEYVYPVEVVGEELRLDELSVGGIGAELEIVCSQRPELAEVFVAEAVSPPAVGEVFDPRSLTSRYLWANAVPYADDPAVVELGWTGRQTVIVTQLTEASNQEQRRVFWSGEIVAMRGRRARVVIGE